MNKNGYDERQLLIQYKIGYQSFFILLFLTLINGFAHNIGIKWANEYDSSIILFFIVGIYFTQRIIACDAYYTKKNAGRFNIMTVIFFIGSFVGIFGLISDVIKGKCIFILHGQLQSPCLPLLSAIFLLSTAVAYWIKRFRDKREEK